MPYKKYLKAKEEVLKTKEKLTLLEVKEKKECDLPYKGQTSYLPLSILN